MNRIQFRNDKGSFVVDARGASLRALNIAGLDLLHGPDLLDPMWNAGTVLFPFPVRLQGGVEFVYGGQTTVWPVNDERHRAALHGLSPEVNFELVQEDKGVRCRWHYDGALEYYPYACVLEVFYGLDRDGFSMTVRVENIGVETMPFHWGWHPYFKVGADFSLKELPTHRLGKNQFSHPMERIPFEGFDWGQEVDGAFLFLGSAVVLVREDAVVRIESPGPWVQLFRPAGASFFAIEPMTGLGHMETPWEELAPKESSQYTVGISVTRR
ncbi:MAG: hypothetical protein RL754_132 [Bacteroidota bacterium]|jgi:aldose 1-epimerase